jgi:hypothetical protein
LIRQRFWLWLKWKVAVARFSTLMAKKNQQYAFRAIFRPQAAGRIRDQARQAGLSAPEAGSVCNPKTQGECRLLLERAVSIHRKAAIGMAGLAQH